MTAKICVQQCIVFKKPCKHIQIQIFIEKKIKIASSDSYLLTAIIFGFDI